MKRPRPQPAEHTTDEAATKAHRYCGDAQQRESSGFEIKERVDREEFDQQIYPAKGATLQLHDEGVSGWRYYLDGKPVHAVTEAILESGSFVITDEEEHYDPHVWMDPLRAATAATQSLR